MSSLQEALAEARKKQKEKHNKFVKKKNLSAKYAKEIALDKKELAAARIVRFMKRHYFGNPIKLFKDKLAGKFICRIRVNGSNKYEDPEIQKAIAESLKYSKPSDREEIHIALDLTLYGINPTLSINIGGELYYLNNKQIIFVRDQWTKINPDTDQGTRFQQLLDYSKAMRDLIRLPSKLKEENVNAEIAALKQNESWGGND